MKKLMVLALVLGIAGLVNASLQLDPTGSGLVDTVKIVGVGNVTKGIPGFVGIVGSTTDAGFAWNYNGSLKAITDFTGADADLTAGLEAAAGVKLDKIYFVEFSDGTATPPTTDGVLATWKLDMGTTFYLQDAEDLSVLGAYTYIPEPMTMGLLALGGLFIRRKK